MKDQTKSLFEFGSAKRNTHQPLADRMRPISLEQMVGQQHLLGPGKVLRVAIERDVIPSMILWGPPGVGKTTLAGLMARVTQSQFISFSAVLSGIKEVRQVMRDAAAYLGSTERRTILFVDEIHRFNKSQQDAFLPYVERGEIILIGATTENPSFEVISALLSRLKVYQLEPLHETHIETLLRRTLTDEERGLGKLKLEISDTALKRVCRFCNGDARVALNVMELAANHVASQASNRRQITPKILENILQRRGLFYDKEGEEHFNIISALHKTMRNSDPDAALYWLGRMLEAGEDPLYVARRMVRFASEDVGLADPRALEVALSAKEAVHFLGMPEGNVALAQAVIYLSLAPKSNSIYVAYNKVRTVLEQSRSEPVPLHLRNAPTKLMSSLDYGRGYEYAHEMPNRLSAMEGLPPSLAGRRFYFPTGEGLEKRFQERLQDIAAIRAGLTKK